MSSQHVQSHYDRPRRESRKARRKHELLPLRNANNEVKRALIETVVSMLPYRCNLRVLDFACGRGGDLPKWKHHRVESYVGVDISPASIDEAKTRADNLRVRFQRAFYTVDLTAKHKGTGDRHIVSMQFAVHYFMRSRETLDALVYNVSTAIRRGGYFICTVPNATEVLKAVCRGVNQGVSGGVYTIHPSKELQEFAKECGTTDGDLPYVPLGLSYRFSMSDFVTECEEYLVNPAILEAAFASAGLQLVTHQSFPEFAKAHSINLDALTDAMLEGFTLYDTYIFHSPYSSSNAS